MGPEARAVADGMSAAARIHTAVGPSPPTTAHNTPHEQGGGSGGSSGRLRAEDDALLPTPQQRVVNNGHIEFEHVHFHYPSRPDVPVLADFSLNVAAGKTTAVVGPSGSGKSTLVGLLERFYDPVSGTISLDGRQLGSLEVGWLRRQMALVGQEALLFDASVFENIANGLVGSAWENASEAAKREMVQRAAETANAHGFVETLPQGYDTRVGERGALLSGMWLVFLLFVHLFLCSGPGRLHPPAVSPRKCPWGILDETFGCADVQVAVHNNART